MGVSSAQSTFFAVLAHWPLVSRLNPFLLSLAWTFVSSSPQTFRSVLPNRVVRPLSPELHPEHITPLPLPIQVTLLPAVPSEQTSSSWYNPIHLFLPTSPRLLTYSSFCAYGVFFVSWTHVPFAFLPLCWWSSSSFGLKYLLSYPHLHLLMSCLFVKSTHMFNNTFLFTLVSKATKKYYW